MYIIEEVTLEEIDVCYYWCLGFIVCGSSHGQTTVKN